MLTPIRFKYHPSYLTGGDRGRTTQDREILITHRVENLERLQTHGLGEKSHLLHANIAFSLVSVASPWLDIFVVLPSQSTMLGIIRWYRPYV